MLERTDVRWGIWNVQNGQAGLAFGAHLGTGMVLLPRLHDTADDTGATVFVLWLLATAVGAVLSGRRPMPVVLSLPADPVVVRRFAGAALVVAASVLAIAAYTDTPAAHLPLVVGAAGAAWALSTLAATVLHAESVGGDEDGPARLVESPAARIGLARGVVAGLVVSTIGAPFLSAVTEFVSVREWHFGFAQTLPGQRFAAMLGCLLMVMSGSSLAGRHDDDETEDDPFADAVETRRSDGALASGADRPLLEVDGVDVRYGKVQVLFGATLHVDHGESLALLGTNGAGKSTVLKAIYGLKEPSAGRVVFDGKDITGMPAEQLVHEGLIQVPGGKGVFPSLTVADNLRMAGYLHKEEARAEEGIARTLATFPRLAERMDQPAGVLSGGEQQMLALGRAWITRPRLLAIDELTLGLAPVIVEELKAVVTGLHDEGVAMILVEQSVHVALELTERAVFLERGRVRFDGLTADLAGRDDLLRSIFFAGAGDHA